MKRIKKITIFLFLILLTMPFTIQAVFADDCSDVMAAVSELEDLELTFKELNCDTATDSQIIYQCNSVLLKKTTVLEKIFKYNDENTCPSIDLSSIISDYENNCSNKFSSKLRVFTDSVMKLFYIAAPFIIVLFGSLDFFKIVVGTDPRENKKHRTNFIKRLIAFLLLYITPFIVRSLFALTPYDMDGLNYICSEEVDLMPKYNSSGVSGTYGGYNYGVGGGGRQDIASAAAEIKQYAIDNNFTYGYPGISALNVATPSNTSKTICCATLVGASLYRAGIYSEEEVSSIHSDSAPYVTRALVARGWIVIWNPDDLKPGDILVYNKTSCSSCGSATIEGKSYYTSHVDIYAGDGKKISTGNPDGFSGDPVYTNFNPNYRSSSTQGFLCGLRYPGK